MERRRKDTAVADEHGLATETREHLHPGPHVADAGRADEDPGERLRLAGERQVRLEARHLAAVGVPVDLDRSGFYVQGVYQFMPQWRLGLRYAELGSDGVSGALAGSALDDFGRAPRSATALLEYDTSEFGRLRVQYTYDDSDLQANSEISAGYTMIIGPHGAHRF